MALSLIKQSKSDYRFFLPLAIPSYEQRENIVLCKGSNKNIKVRFLSTTNLSLLHKYGKKQEEG